MYGGLEIDSQTFVTYSSEIPNLIKSLEFKTVELEQEI